MYCVKRFDLYKAAQSSESQQERDQEREKN